MADGGEFRVNTQTTGYNISPAITNLTGGGFVVSWADDIGSVNSIRAQLYDASGTKVGTEFVVNAPGHSDQGLPDVAALTNGGFVVSWDDFNNNSSGFGGPDIEAQIFDAGGAKVGGQFLVNTVTAGFQDFGGVAGLADGGFVAVWSSNTLAQGSRPTIETQLYNAGGQRIGGEFQVNTLFDFNSDASVASLANGDFAVVWTDQSIGGPTKVEAQIFTASGAKVGGEFQVNTHADYAQSPAIASLANGDFVVSWTDDGPTGNVRNGTTIEAQIFDASGAKVGGEFQASTTDAVNTISSAGALANGGFMINWSESQSVFTVSSAVAGQMFDASGHKVGGEFLVEAPATSTSVITSSDTAGLSNGSSVVVFHDGTNDQGNVTGDIYARLYDPAKPILFDSNANSVDFNGKNTADFTGPFNYAGAGDDVVVLPGSASGVTAWNLQNGFHAGDGNDSVTGGAAAVTVFGENGNDVLTGSSTADLLYGGDGNDVLVGGAGTDLLFGDAGADVFRFVAASDSTVGSTTRDQVKDFTVGEDKIDLTPILGSNFHLVDQFTGGGMEVREDHSAGNSWVTLSIDIDGNKKADMQISVHTGGSLLTIADFIHM